MIDYIEVGKSLSVAMGGLYEARAKVLGTKTSEDKCFTDMDMDIFNEISAIQNQLQSLIGKVNKKK